MMTSLGFWCKNFINTQTHKTLPCGSSKIFHNILWFPISPQRVEGPGTSDPWPIIKITYHIPRLGPFCHFPIKIPKLKNLKRIWLFLFEISSELEIFAGKDVFRNFFRRQIFFISLLYVSLSSWKRDKGGDIWRNKIIITTQIQLIRPKSFQISWPNWGGI